MRPVTLPRLVTAIFSLLILKGAVESRADEPRLAALSSRAYVGTGSQVLIPGIIITGASKTVLIRASGPALAAAFPSLASQALANPRLDLYGDPSQPPIASNDDWGTPIGAGAASASTLASTFASVGLGPFASGSKDAALLITLPPGGYTAQVSGVGGTTGISVVEVYEVGGGTAKLYAISTRAQVGINDAVLIPGIAVTAGTGTRRFIVRAVGPGLASAFPGSFPAGTTLPDPTVSVVNQSTGGVLASNDNWGTPVGTNAYDAATLGAAFSQFGMFPIPSGSKDAALIADFPPGNYTVLVSGVGGGTGIAIVEVYDITPSSGSAATVNVTASDSSADESGSNPGEYTFSRLGDTFGPLSVSYGISGSAANGYDYATLPGTITFPPGASSVKLALLPNPTVQNGGSKTATVSLSADPSYVVGTQSSATVTIAYTPATLYVATLRPATGASSSTASGTATILLSPSGTLASVTVSFSTLSSNEVTAHLTLGTNQDFVFSLPQGQVNGAQWTFGPSSTYSSADLLNALKTGNISVRIDTANYPTGEVQGAFIQSVGVQAFVPPTAPPAVSLTNVTAADAARFLTQATFGPKQSEIDTLTGSSIDAWVTAQLAMPFTSHRAAILADQATYGGSNSFTNWNAITLSNRQSAWWKTVLTAPDQLRQRVAFALSEILVVSDVSLGGDNQAEPLATYYDILGNGAFGNFRTLLENVTLNPMMGNYLSSLRNSKADPVTGQTPDENYAREVMQLFTIGLSMLQPDGTLQLGADGLPIATYTQSTVTEMAKVFTGWSYFGTTNFRNGGGSVASLTNPMIQFPANHDDTVKNIVNGVVIPANQGGAQDLKLALDALFNHPNTGPFISKLLIQRLVTSNPSPAYVYRVAQKFANNGSGVRGDLAAVVRAIFTDYEARSPSIAGNITFGKLKEPLLRLANLLRSCNASAPNGRYLGVQVTVNGVNINGSTPIPALSTSIAVTSSATRLDNVQTQLAEASLRSPTVFNFFHPGYVLPGALAAAGLVAPEYEITDATFSIDVPNYLRTFVFTTNTSGTASALVTVAPDFTAEQALAGTPSALIDHLNAILCEGAMPQATKDRILAALSALPGTTTSLERVQSAVLLVLTSPAGATQK